MRKAYGVHYQWRDGSIRTVAVCDTHGQAQLIYHKLQTYLQCREQFGCTPANSHIPENQKLFEFFEELERGKRESEIVRSGIGEVLLYTEEADRA